MLLHQAARPRHHGQRDLVPLQLQQRDKRGVVHAHCRGAVHSHDLITAPVGKQQLVGDSFPTLSLMTLSLSRIFIPLSSADRRVTPLFSAC